MNKNAKIFVAGSNGLVGSAIVRRLRSGGYTNLLTQEIDELNLTDQQAVADGTPRKLLDVSRMKALNWAAKVSLREGIEKAYQWFLDNEDNYRN